MSKIKLILIGGGGHCKSCIDVIESEGKYSIMGVLDLPNELGNKVLNYRVIGNDNDIDKYAEYGYSFLITLGHMGNSKRRKELFKLVNKVGGELPVIISSKAYVSKYANIGRGTIIMHNAIVNTEAIIGDNCIINSKALIEHDAMIGNDCHISTNAIINGNCKVGDDCFIGSNASLKNGIEIEKGSFIGIGSVVTKTVVEKGLYFGNPAKKIKTI
jgi:sugar O-acyltransferase (sialic acid O-acetyltransferase NeuD family)